MRKLIVTEFLTLDGVYQAPGDPNEDPSGGFEFGGWSRPYFDDVQLQSAAQGIAANGAYLFGRKTYEIMAAFWPNQPDTDAFAATLNGLPKYVASTTLREPLAWQNSTLIKGDVAEAIRRLKEGPGKNITVLGSGDLVQTLIRNDLVDQFELLVHPIALGTGKRLFHEGKAPNYLRLVDSKPTSTGVLLLTFEPTRAPEGSQS